MVKHDRYNSEGDTIRSVLEFKLDVDTQRTLVGAVWWCEVEMEFPMRTEPIVARSSVAPFRTTQRK